jgi:tetratricopeptide (TPR) repeat protein
MLARTEQAIGNRAAQARARAAEAAARSAEAAARTAHAPESAGAAHPVSSAPPLSDREAEDLYRRGLAAVRAQRSDDAIRYWELVWSSRPDYREVATCLKREYLTRGMEAFAAGRVDDATSEWQRVLRVDPDDARARGYLERARQQRARSREILGGTP